MRLLGIVGSRYLRLPLHSLAASLNSQHAARCQYLRDWSTKAATTDELTHRVFLIGGTSGRQRLPPMTQKPTLEIFANGITDKGVINTKIQLGGELRAVF
jgi:hypothetical protein